MDSWLRLCGLGIEEDNTFLKFLVFDIIQNIYVLLLCIYIYFTLFSLGDFSSKAIICYVEIIVHATKTDWRPAQPVRHIPAVTHGFLNFRRAAVMFTHLAHDMCFFYVTWSLILFTI